MMSANTFDVRKGITPVVAIVMLLMLTIVVAGGVFAFINTFMGEQEDDLLQQQATDIQFVDLTCDSDSDLIEYTVRNAGETEVDVSEVDFYIYDPDNSLVGNPVLQSGDELTPEDRHWSGDFTTDDGELESGYRYTVEAEFVSDDASPTASGGCTP